MASEIDPGDVLSALLEAAARAGAPAADASFAHRESLSVDVRLGALEGVEREEARSVALRVLDGRRQAAAASTDTSKTGLAALAERVVAMARAAPEDPYCGLLDREHRATRFPEIDSYDGTELAAARLEEIARACEAAALAIPGVTNSAGSGASLERSIGGYATSDGFMGFVRGGSYGVGVSVIAEKDGAKERDYESRSRRHFADLPSAEEIGKAAGARAAARLGARKIDSQRAAVIFEPRVAGRLIGPMLGAISGTAIARGVSFLKDKLHERVFPEGFVIEDDPLRPRGPASRPFDGEGGAVSRRLLIEDGVLTTWLLNSAAARQLNLTPTGHATFGHGGPPGVGASNVTVKPGARSRAALMADARRGVLVTEMFSPALNANTGDWSVGVAGFWFEAGEISFPVSEITIAGNLRDIFARLVPGDDLERRGALDAPSLLVDDLAIAGR